jgi:hypothetical protein
MPSRAPTNRRWLPTEIVLTCVAVALANVPSARFATGTNSTPFSSLSSLWPSGAPAVASSSLVSAVEHAPNASLSFSSSSCAVARGELARVIRRPPLRWTVEDAEEYAESVHLRQHMSAHVRFLPANHKTGSLLAECIRKSVCEPQSALRQCAYCVVVVIIVQP